MLVSFGAHGGTVDLMTALHEAYLGGHPEVVDVLIAEGADVCITAVLVLTSVGLKIINS